MNFFLDLFETIITPTSEDLERPVYAVIPIPNFVSYFIGKDQKSCACILISVAEVSTKPQNPIRLKNIDVQFNIPCNLKTKHHEKKGYFTVIRCRSQTPEVIRYFLSVCGTVLCLLGDEPNQRDISSVIKRLAIIFQKVQTPPVRTINGLFGELYLIFRSSNPFATLAAWRSDDTARFDFVDDDKRIDVKVTSNRVRSHTFSYEQCNPPPGSMAVVASMFVEHQFQGLTLQTLIDEISAMVISDSDLVFKLHEVVSSTLGTNFNEAMTLGFDRRLADSSLCFYKLTEIPAIRNSLPIGVNNVHFKSDLLGSAEMSIQTMIDWNPDFSALLPQQD